ncbi:SDR family NAD(P)-dependent oxidoreductase [Lacticaseibacillus brantae]|uniref:Carbonyl reductase n=1 Tax=Lacticaseibacillus brantae DSM 23927 TaxID=1423727 RepID=A0A0R2AYI3_9LACO|nr:SDR family NAD(P)-dependent oxidoreductase [Lacticaseibacillus brantae]KRM72135.1 hypothetical protein FC34_GL001119 [Lacticaseibacillus brantae DSM 23927]
MKTAFITGGNKGIGFALAKALGLAGWQVVIGVRTEANGQKALTQLAAAGVSQASFLILDLSQSDTVAAAAAQLKDRYPDFTLLINNAGVPGNMGSSVEETESDLRSTMEVNFFGTFQLTQLAIPLLNENHGRIINVTIPTAANPMWNPLAYKASKAAQNVMMDSLAIDLTKAKKNVEIFSIHPGPTTTDLNGNTKLPGFHTPDDVANQMIQIVEDGRSHHGEFIEIYSELK